MTKTSLTFENLSCRYLHRYSNCLHYRRFVKNILGFNTMNKIKFLFYLNDVPTNIDIKSVYDIKERHATLILDFNI